MHQLYDKHDTIAAIATPPGEGGVAIIRISGKEAISVASRIFSGPIRNYKSHTAHYGSIRSLEGEHVDDVLVLPMLDKRSYTGEDTVEIHCHGGSLITRKVLETVLNAGARSALPGEFTFRAYMNGKMDLAQAESVQQLIGAKNEHAVKAAENHLKGALSEKIGHFQREMTQIAAILEAWVDFPEEGLEFASLEELYTQLFHIVQQMRALENTFHDGRIIQEGISLCLIGAPNVGKSSLMNALLDKERSIVSPIPGTTRDLLEDQMRLNGLNLRLIDTAGIRESQEWVEQEGIRRSKEAMDKADLILLVLDLSQSLDADSRAIIEQSPKNRTIIIWNKADLPHNKPSDFLPYPHVVSISAKEKIGLDLLRQKIDDVIWEKGPPAQDEVMITSLRHKEALNQAITSAQSVIQGLKSQLSPEFLTLDMRRSLNELGKIIGTNITEDILSAIFSKFCIGK